MPLVAPPIPERVRTLAATAVPTHVSLAGSPRPAVPARGGVDRAGRPVLLLPEEHPLYAVEPQTVATVDLIATRELAGAARPRGMLKAQGWLEPVPAADVRRSAVAIAETCPDEGLFAAVEAAAAELDGDSPAPGTPRLLRMDIGQVIYLVGQESGVLDAEEYLGAAPDPLMAAAEAMIRHVNGCHREQLAHAVAHLAGPLDGEVWIWELDRYGVTVRVGLADPTLIRLPWSRPVATQRGLESALHGLIQHAQT
ncbi:hypothetical protein HNP84_001779 [Thermocatellispora tengchongensis]|uniref:DUF2470 domain-containing protein n=1 Tax=Thermocatellispora tengchongensis TaxID=1073253 RepID=A0A840P0S5_9ACTN|nr:DUF2470 domain-containing protein [Thermocatellispora tengchongensis]MBB5132066.1 hypothetical protein [Thermocatellispora tengchongensis]